MLILETWAMPGKNSKTLSLAEFAEKGKCILPAGCAGLPEWVFLSLPAKIGFQLSDLCVLERPKGSGREERY